MRLDCNHYQMKLIVVDLIDLHHFALGMDYYQEAVPIYSLYAFYINIYLMTFLYLKNT